MPILTRNPVQNEIQQPTLKEGQYSGSGIIPTVKVDTSAENIRNARHGFVQSLLKVGAEAATQYGKTVEDEATAQGEADNLAGKDKADDKSWLTQSAYDKGYNSVTADSHVANYNMQLQNLASTEAEKGSDETTYTQKQKDLASKTISNITSLNLSPEQHKAYISSIAHSTATGLVSFNQAAQKHLQTQHASVLSAKYNQANTNIQSNLQANHPDLAVSSYNNLISEIQSDPILTDTQKRGFIVQASNGVLANTNTNQQTNTMMGAINQNEAFKELEPQLQSSIKQTALKRNVAIQRKSLSGLNDYVATAMHDTTGSYTPKIVKSKIWQSVDSGSITTAQGYKLYDTYNKSYMKAQSGKNLSALALGGTTDDYMKYAGVTSSKASTDISKAYVDAYQTTSLAGAKMVEDGMTRNDEARIAGGVDLLHNDIETASNMDWNKVKTDKDGNLIADNNVSTSLAELLTLHQYLAKNGYNSQDADLLSKIPSPAVRKAIEQTSNRDSLIANIQANTRLINQGVDLPPSTMPNSMKIASNNDYADLQYNMFDFGIGAESAFKKTFGVKSYGFTSDADKLALAARSSEVNIIQEKEYRRLFLSGKLDSMSEGNQKALVQLQAEQHTIRLEGKDSDLGALVYFGGISDADKVKFYGSSDNDVMKYAFAKESEAVLKRHPRATNVEYETDSVTGETKAYLKDKMGSTLGTDVIPSSDIRTDIEEHQKEMARQSQGKMTVAYSANAQPIPYRTNPSTGLDDNQYIGVMNYTTNYGDYNKKRGFNITKEAPEEYQYSDGDTEQQSFKKVQDYMDNTVIPTMLKGLRAYSDLPASYLSEAKDTIAQSIFADGGNGILEYMNRIKSGEDFDTVWNEYTNTDAYKQTYKLNKSVIASRKQVMRDEYNLLNDK